MSGYCLALKSPLFSTGGSGGERGSPLGWTAERSSRTPPQPIRLQNQRRNPDAQPTRKLLDRTRHQTLLVLPQGSRAAPRREFRRWVGADLREVRPRGARDDCACPTVACPALPQRSRAPVFVVSAQAKHGGAGGTGRAEDARHPYHKWVRSPSWGLIFGVSHCERCHVFASPENQYGECAGAQSCR